MTTVERLTRKCLGERRITAFVAVNDMVAYGVLDAIRAEGRRVPEDYSVCGFDNIFPSQFLPVGLTTVEHYIADKGRNAFEILHSKMSGESSDRNITRVEFKHHLIVRDSTAAPRGEEKTGEGTDEGEAGTLCGPPYPSDLFQMAHGCGLARKAPETGTLLQIIHGISGSFV